MTTLEHVGQTGNAQNRIVIPGVDTASFFAAHAPAVPLWDFPVPMPPRPSLKTDLMSDEAVA